MYAILLLINIVTSVLLVICVNVHSTDIIDPYAQFPVYTITASTSLYHEMPESPERKNQDQADTKGEQEEKEENKTEYDELLLNTSQYGTHVSLQTLAFFHHRKSGLSLVLLEKPIQPPRRYM